MYTKNPNNLHLSKNRPSQQILYLQKQRPPIFTQSYIYTHKRKIFQDIYSSPILKQLSFLINDQYEPCDCLRSINQCFKFKGIIKQFKRNQAKGVFEKFKESNGSGRDVGYLNRTSDIQEVLEPHYLNLVSVLNVDHFQVIIQILKHAKKDYSTFWIYGLFCAKLPEYQTFASNIKKITQKLNLAIDLQGLLQGGQQSTLYKTYRAKFLNIFPQSYSTIVNLIIKQPSQRMIAQKLTICHYIKGRQRKQFQIIQAALQIQ